MFIFTLYSFINSQAEFTGSNKNNEMYVQQQNILVMTNTEFTQMTSNQPFCCDDSSMIVINAANCSKLPFYTLYYTIIFILY